VVQAEQQVDPQEEENRVLTALTELFKQTRTQQTPVIVGQIVKEIDEIVRVVRFPDWQRTIAGERDIKKALRRVLLKYQLHTDSELFEKAYAYIKQYY
jgi:type I restriction enzyme R subunit